MADFVSVALRFVHIMFGVAWIGGVMYGVGVLRRAIPKMEPSARKEMMRRLIPVMTQYIPGSAAMTILFGFALYLYMGEFKPDLLIGSRWGLTILSALVLSLVTLAIGIVLGLMGGKKILAHLNEESCPHGPEVGVLQKRLNLSQIVALVLGFVIIGLMVAATTRSF